MNPRIEVVLPTAANEREGERDRIAWNLPEGAGDRHAHGAPVQADSDRGLDWEAFSARYFPGSRRHNLKAIAAYAAYRRDLAEGSEKAKAETDRPLTGEGSESALGASGAGIPRNA